MERRKLAFRKEWKEKWNKCKYFQDSPDPEDMTNHEIRNEISSL